MDFTPLRLRLLDKLYAQAMAGDLNAARLFLEHTYPGYPGPAPLPADPHNAGDCARK